MCCIYAYIPLGRILHDAEGSGISEVERNGSGTMDLRGNNPVRPHMSRSEGCHMFGESYVQSEVNTAKPLFHRQNGGCLREGIGARARRSKTSAGVAEGGCPCRAQIPVGYEGHFAFAQACCLGHMGDFAVILGRFRGEQRGGWGNVAYFPIRDPSWIASPEQRSQSRSVVLTRENHDPPSLPANGENKGSCRRIRPRSPAPGSI